MTPTSDRFGRPSALALAGLLVASLLPGASRAADIEGVGSLVQTAELSYHEAPSSFINWSVSPTTQSAPFAKEPALSNSKVYRGKFQIGGNATNVIAFIWDRSAGMLYLDLNRNLDLTDDPGGVWSVPKAQRSNYQSFTNVRLPCPTPSGDRQMVGDLNLYDYSNRPNGTFTLRSLWQGKMTLHGEAWEVGLVENDFNRTGSAEGGYLLLRPWAKHDQPFSVYDGSLQAVPFAKKLFLNGHAYKLDVTSASAEKVLRLQFTEEHPALAEAKITGKFIQRLTLEGGPYQVILDQPEVVVRLPVGSYSEPQVALQSGDSAAHEVSNQARMARKIAITEKTAAILDVGGPLTNSVSVSRRGSSLYLSYQLLGAGGRTYTRNNEDRTKPPEFVVFHAGRKVGSGKFEFG